MTRIWNDLALAVDYGWSFSVALALLALSLLATPFAFCWMMAAKTVNTISMCN